MNELKAVHVVDVYDEYSANPYNEAQVYLKSEADKVIADLEESHKKEVGQLLIEIMKLKNKINEAQTELELWRDGYIISEAHQKELDGKRHSDYKRCVAMVETCCNKKENCYNRALRKYTKAESDCLIHKSDFWENWELRWLAIAEKFKPNSTAQHGEEEVEVK